METMQVPKGIYLDASMDLIYPQGAKMTDGFPEDLRAVLHPHWESFPPQNPLILYCFGIFLMALSVICLVINASILYVFVTAKSLRSAVSMFFFFSIEQTSQNLCFLFSVQYFHCEFGLI